MESRIYSFVRLDCADGVHGGPDDLLGTNRILGSTSVMRLRLVGDLVLNSV